MYLSFKDTDKIILSNLNNYHLSLLSSVNKNIYNVIQNIFKERLSILNSSPNREYPNKSFSYIYKQCYYYKKLLLLDEGRSLGFFDTLDEDYEKVYFQFIEVGYEENEKESYGYFVDIPKSCEKKYIYPLKYLMYDFDAQYIIYMIREEDDVLKFAINFIYNSGIQKHIYELIEEVTYTGRIDILEYIFQDLKVGIDIIKEHASSLNNKRKVLVDKWIKEKILQKK